MHRLLRPVQWFLSLLQRRQFLFAAVFDRPFDQRPVTLQQQILSAGHYIRPRRRLFHQHLWRRSPAVCHIQPQRLPRRTRKQQNMLVIRKPVRGRNLKSLPFQDLRFSRAHGTTCNCPCPGIPTRTYFPSSLTSHPYPPSPIFTADPPSRLCTFTE